MVASASATRDENETLTTPAEINPTTALNVMSEHILSLKSGK